ncbi:MAG: hypothetical protein COA57_15560 [Flavobacteriales bacterium]|nr:MAG: hypothetical protein COA57_15560 [Flavobacteriales bacterium]
MNFKKLLMPCRALLMLILIAQGTVVFAQQSTYDKVYSIFQAKCMSCHSGTTPAGSLDLSDSASVVYANIVDQNPVNSVALGKGDKLIDPGYPHRSYLLRLCNNGLDPDNGVTSGEADTVHWAPSPSLVNYETELIRQWVLFGAPDTGEVVEEQLLIDFYNGQGIVQINPPPKPDTSLGFQVHIGPIFLPPSTEREYFKKHEIRNTQAVEVDRMDVQMNGQSHHFALYKYYPNADTNAFFTEGLRLVDGILIASGLFYNAEVIAQWQYSRNIELPQGTAFDWQENSVLDFNYHLLNYSPDSILAAEIYINIYTNPPDTATEKMLSLPVYYGDNNPAALFIFNNGQDTTFTINQFYPDSDQVWNIWVLQSHTHSLGVDFDVWLRNTDGTKGQQVYEGFFDTDYTFNQGYFDWEHPAVREFDPMMSVNMRDNGFIHDAIFNNSGPDSVGFGLTNEDEMFVTYMHYTKTDINCSTLSATVSSTDETSAGSNDGSATFTASGGMAPYTYLWDTAAMSQTTATATALGAGTYSVTVTDLGGCTVVGSAVVTTAVGIGEEDNGEKPLVSVYPNPNNGKFELRYKGIDASTTLSVTIYNVLGERVYETGVKHQASMRIDISSQPMGIYFYEISSREEGKEITGRGKFVVQ